VVLSPKDQIIPQRPLPNWPKWLGGKLFREKGEFRAELS